MALRRNFLLLLLAICLWVLVCGLWTFSHFSRIDFSFPVHSGDTRRTIFANHGLILLFATENYPLNQGCTVIFGHINPQSFDQNYWQSSTLGFYRRTTQIPYVPQMDAHGGLPAYIPSAIMSRHAVAVPYWSLGTVATVLLLAAIWRWRRSARRHHQGLCPACGYDLRASQDRCPECGLLRKSAISTQEPNRTA
jgi:hypothetical protein